MFISTATSTDGAARAATVAVLPVGSFEQHGDHLPLATDSLIAGIIAKRISDDYNLFLLPPITIGCSHEHAGFVGSVSISSPGRSDPAPPADSTSRASRYWLRPAMESGLGRHIPSTPCLPEPGRPPHRRQ